jgi:hypothetical protein
MKGRKYKDDKPNRIKRFRMWDRNRMVLRRRPRLLNVAGMKQVRNVTKILLEKLKGKGHLKDQDQGVNRSIILKCILECIKMLTESFWVQI